MTDYDKNREIQRRTAAVDVDNRDIKYEEALLQLYQKKLEMMYYQKALERETSLATNSSPSSSSQQS